MKRTLIYIVAFTLTATALILAEVASARTEERNSPHIDSAVQFPQTKWKIVRHTIKLHVPQESNALSQVIIDVPAGLTANDNISLSDQSNREINTNVTVNGRQVTLTFLQPVAPGTELEIDMNNVKISGISNGWLYRVSVKYAGSDTKFPLGVARIPIY